MKEDEMKTIVALVDKVISSPDSEDLLSTVMSEVLDLCRDFPLYRDLVS
jgi:glycine/serine hydroxymethyltransferase